MRRETRSSTKMKRAAISKELQNLADSSEDVTDDQGDNGNDADSGVFEGAPLSTSSNSLEGKATEYQKKFDIQPRSRGVSVLGGMESMSAQSFHPYVAMCKSCACEVDPSVLTSLATDWTYIKASNSHPLLPLLLLVREERKASELDTPTSAVTMNRPQLRDRLETLRVRHADVPTHLTDANARVIGFLLRECKNLKHVDISRMKLSQFGAREIITGLYDCPSLESLNISYNPGIAPALPQADLAELLTKLPRLTLLDITNDQLGFSQVQVLHDAMKKMHAKSGIAYEIHDGGNNVFEEVLNALTHGIGVMMSIVGTVVMMYHATAEHQSRRTFYACLVYCACLILLFVSSTLLHAAFLNRRLSSVLSLVDHTAIYFLIAGTYLPFCVVSLEKHPYGWMMALGEWILAFIGIVLCIVHHRVKVPFMMPIELSLYLGMGWMIGIAWEDVQTHISPGAVELLLYGGLAYTAGIIFFLLEKIKHPIGHAIWHIFVLIGATCHYFAVLFFVVGLEEENSRLASIVDVTLPL